MGVRTRHVALSTGLLAVLMAPLGVAATGDVLREGRRNGTATQETEIVARVDATTARKGGYSTRQSNLSATGGGAIYGCRAGVGGTAGNPPTAPCLRANNLSTGFAFEFHATNGNVVGTITTGSGGDSKKPFTTNATGVATGLNADRVDGQEAADLATRWFLLDEKGEIEEQSGGFKVIEAYATGDPNNVYVDAGESLEGRALTATLAATTSFSGGEVGVARCQTAAFECVPAAAKNVNSLVVAPRLSNGDPTEPNSRKRVYVAITG